ncbi:MAG: SET domain-containing protein [Chakrabartia sp.]
MTRRRDALERPKMLLVPTFVAPSLIEGVGLFAASDIAAGTILWRFDPLFDRLMRPEDIAALDPVQQAYVERYGYRFEGDRRLTVVEGDNGRFMNHSGTPNTDFTVPGHGTARIDILAGTELLCDYGEFDPGFTMLPGQNFLAARQLETI